MEKIFKHSKLQFSFQYLFYNLFFFWLFLHTTNNEQKWDIKTRGDEICVKIKLWKLIFFFYFKVYTGRSHQLAFLSCKLAQCGLFKVSVLYILPGNLFALCLIVSPLLLFVCNNVTDQQQCDGVSITLQYHS